MVDLEPCICCGQQVETLDPSIFGEQVCWSCYSICEFAEHYLPCRDRDDCA